MTAADLKHEAEVRDAFIRQRLERPLSPGERKDLTDFFHDENAELLACGRCGLLQRSQQESPSIATYSEDDYDAAAIEHVYPKYLRAFAAKEHPYRELVPPGGRIIELGSHYGAFLETACEWGWKATGVDVGEDSSRFARSKGCDVRIGELPECGFATGSLDGVFIWNCFDQIQNPQPVLHESARILKNGGVLVVRTPNGLFYRRVQEQLKQAGLADVAREFLTNALAYNNLLGFPYQYGYSRNNLEKLIEPFGFRFEGMLNSELITLPLPNEPGWVLEEERAISEGIDLLAHSVLRNRTGELAGPWIELWFRRATS